MFTLAVLFCVPVILCCNFVMVNSVFMCYLILLRCGCVLEVFVMVTSVLMCYFILLRCGCVLGVFVFYDNVGLYIFMH